METNLFSRYAHLLRGMIGAELRNEIDRPDRLLIESGYHGDKRLDIAYAPFDHVNPNARIVIVGLTPGRQQMRNALNEAWRQLRAGRTEEDALAAAKVYASFSGPMRANLVAMLDSVGVNHVVGLPSTTSLWNGDAGLVHFTSALRYPVFVEGENYSGAPAILYIPLLRAQLLRWFAKEMRALQDAIFVPLGPKVREALEAATTQAGVSKNRILSGLPHPSGANAERIASFLGRKSRSMLSAKVAPDRILADRAALEQKIAEL